MTNEKVAHEVVIGTESHGAYIVFALTTDQRGTVLGLQVCRPGRDKSPRHYRFTARPYAALVMEGMIRGFETDGMKVVWRGYPNGR